ncbi:D-hexose-6-phosphate mutarotase [Psychromonas sp. SR45-3]|uniref:D-hexose-6-phosphate mutarotase n=1 Tax=Psychromonas sp. SR45-3 TaxID=2760930 RepID=UPI0015F78D0F|nr:D-hexose-6-phosphate mutarotase [Psychromonas sp. SR45-3]MBB1273014.1 D-hexose-6-phosphate mutarotase [Psychromonas sp. SR45-3]
MISHLRLNTTKTLSEQISLQVDSKGFEFIIINHPKFDAAFTLHGAHLIHFQVKQQAPLIYLSKTALFDDKKAIRGGVPVCWPWFGNTEESLSKKLPGHGFARISKWEMSIVSETSEGIDLAFTLSANGTTKAIWDHDFTLTLKASLSDHVELSLITENTGTETFKYGGALHSYLCVADITQSSIEGLAATYTDSLDSGKQKTAEAVLTVNEPIDTIYSVNNGDVTINDLQNQRKITVNNTGNDSVVVWNPWISGSIAFADMPDDGYQTMMCIESAITSKQGVLVVPGESHTLKTVIK